MQQLHNAFKPTLADLKKLRARMETNQFPKHERIYLDAILSEQTINDLVMEIEALLSYRRSTVTPDPFR